MIFGFTQNELIETGGYHTASEIWQQPDLWQEIYRLVGKKKEEIEDFLKLAYGEADQIILTGAGSSAFVGLSLQGVFQRKTGLVCRAISTTDILSHPHDFFSADQVPLVISFARSGNSPESCAALQLIESICKKSFNLIITCNKNGQLALYESNSPALRLLLPEKANDKALAMTSSYTSMLLTGLLIAYTREFEETEEQVNLLSKYAKIALTEFADRIRIISKKKFTRAVFLGSGPLYGTATEAHLKLQELTDGKIVCKNDSYLGFRHGPKSVIDNNTLVVYFFSNNDYVKKYEEDFLHSMLKGNKALSEMGIGESDTGTILNLDSTFYFGEINSLLNEDFLPLCSIIPVHILCFFKAIELGIKPDQPSANGAITRVVEGVNIHPLERKIRLISRK